MTNITHSPKEIRDAIYALLQTITGEDKALSGCWKVHEVQPSAYPFASVEPGDVVPAELLTNVEILRPWPYTILVQYGTLSGEDVASVPAILRAWDACMDATYAVMNALDTATNLGLAWVAQITPAKPRAGKVKVWDGLCVYYLIDVAIWTVFDKV